MIESLLPGLKDRPWFKVGDVYLLVTNEYDAVRAVSTSSARSSRTVGSRCAVVHIAHTPIASLSS